MITANNIWRVLVGEPDNFSPANRVFNSASIITTALLLVVTAVNLKLELWASFYINLTVLTIQIVLYYASRFKKKYKSAIIIYAISSYVTLTINYFYNGGINGPSIFVFFLTFQLLIAITRRASHIYWATLHIIAAGLILVLEYAYPELVKVHYTSRDERYVDIMSTYFICLLFIYLITIHLRNSFSKEKQLAEKRSKEIKHHLKEIEQQNEKLKEIAWMQSHKVRGKVATIMGLCQFINEKDLDEAEHQKVLEGIKTASLELDEVVKEINNLTIKAKIEHTSPPQ